MAHVDTVTVRTTVATWARPRRRFHRRTTLPGSARTSAPAAAATTGQPSDLTAVVLVIAGIIALTRKQMLQGVALIVVGLLIGPGGVSIFT